jgi:hypothetical protein
MCPLKRGNSKKSLNLILEMAFAIIFLGTLLMILGMLRTLYKLLLKLICFNKEILEFGERIHISHKHLPHILFSGVL